MPVWLWIVIFVAALASRPIEVRMWRAGRLSDRALTLLLVGRLPLLALVFAVAEGASVGLGLLLVGISVIPGALMYRHVFNLVRTQKAAPSDIQQR